jgi:hypothetical protein
MLIYYSCIERFHLLKSIWLFQTSLDYMISKNRSLLRNVNCGRNQNHFSFKRPHNETTNETLTMYFTLKWKISRKSSSNLNGWSALRRLSPPLLQDSYGYLITLFQNYWSECNPAKKNNNNNLYYVKK